MSFNSNKARMEYIVSSTTNDYTYNFQIFEDTDLEVYLVPKDTVANDTTNILIPGTDYITTINGDTGGYISLTNTPTIDDIIVIQRNLDIDRDVSFTPNSVIYADTLNEDQNYQTYLLSDNYLQTDRSIQLPKSVTGVSVTLTEPEPNAVIRWDETGTQLINDAEFGAEITLAQQYRDWSWEWAVQPEDTLVTDTEKPEGYSSYHYSRKTEADAIQTASDNLNITTRLDTVQTNTNTVEQNLEIITTEPHFTNLNNAETNATLASNSATNASLSENNSQLTAWESEASKMTADSYAQEAEDVNVKIYTSNGDGTFSPTTTSDYSAYHYKMKTQQINNLELDSLADVDTVGKQEGSALVYDIASSMWIVGSGVPETVAPLVSSTDVNVVMNSTVEVQILDYHDSITYFTKTDDDTVATITQSGDILTIEGADILVDETTVVSVRGIAPGMTVSKWTDIDVTTLYVPIADDGSIINTDFEEYELESDGFTF